MKNFYLTHHCIQTGIRSSTKTFTEQCTIADWNHNDEGQMRQLISVDEMTKLVNSTMDVRDKAVITLLAKTGIKRKELITLDVDDIDWVDQSIRLKPTPKRTNRIVFFDD